MNVLIIYGTTEGQTRKIAAWTGGGIIFAPKGGPSLAHPEGRNVADNRI